MIVFECPKCQTKLQVADEHAGLTIQCPSCKTQVAAPKSAGESAAAIKAAPSVEPAPDDGTAVAKPEHAKSARKGRDRDDDADDDRPRRDKSETTPAAKAGMGVGIVLLIVGLSACCLVGAGAMLVALLVPAVQKTREAAARSQSMNNLKQIGLGAHAFNDVNRRFPFNGSDEQPLGFGPQPFPPVGPGQKYTKAAVGNAPMSGSWGFQMLPYIEQQAIFVVPNRNVAIPTFLCPGRGRPGVEFTNGGGAWSDYFYNNYLNDPNNANKADARDSRRTPMNITDGTSNTVMFGHGNIQLSQYQSSGNVTMSSNIFNGGTFGTARGGNPGQTSPGGVFLARDSEAAPGIGSWGGPFPGGAIVVMCDGSARIVPYNTPGFNAMLTPTGNEAVMIP